MTGAARVLDTGALLAYARQTDPQVAGALRASAAYDLQVLVPVTALAEAYLAAEGIETDMLDLLATLPAVDVVPLVKGEVSLVGHLAKQAGRLGLAQACLVSTAGRVMVMTAEPEKAITLVGEEILVWDVQPPSGSGQE